MTAVLHTHFHRHFGAQNLRVAILGASPLPRLSVLLERYFGNLPRSLGDAPDYSTMGFPFEGALVAVFGHVSASSFCHRQPVLTSRYHPFSQCDLDSVTLCLPARHLKLSEIVCSCVQDLYAPRKAVMTRPGTSYFSYGTTWTERP